MLAALLGLVCISFVLAVAVCMVGAVVKLGLLVSLWVRRGTGVFGCRE